MGGPWEQYRPTAPAPKGPWEAFGAQPATPTEGGGFNVDILPQSPDTAPAAQQGIVQALKAGGAILGGILAPQVGIPAAAGPVLIRYGGPVLNTGLRMLGAGTGSMTGGATGETVQGNAPTFPQMAEDFKQGAQAEAIGTTVALPVKVLGKLGGWLFNKGLGMTGKVAKDAAGDAGVGAGKWFFDRLTKVVGGNDAPIPAPKTLGLVTKELIDPQTGAWNPLARKLFGQETKAPMGSRGAAEQAVAGAPPKIGGTTAWQVTPKGEIDPAYATVKAPGSDWVPWYVVHSDGGAELFFQQPKMGLFRAAGSTGKPGKELLTEDQMLRYVGAQRAGVPAVGVVQATEAAPGKFVPRGKLFDVARRDDAMPWRELNDFSAKFRNRDFSNLSKEEIDTFMRLRDAVEADVKAHSPAAAKEWDRAWRAYRFGRDPVGKIGKASAKYAVKPLSTAGTMLLQPSHEQK